MEAVFQPKVSGLCVCHTLVAIGGKYKVSPIGIGCKGVFLQEKTPKNEKQKQDYNRSSAHKIYFLA